MLLLAVSPLLAQDNSFKIYGGLAYVSPLSDENVDIDGVVDSLQASSEAGWNLGVEFRFNKLLGLELDGVHATQDIEFGGNTIADVDFTPLSATLDFHLIHTKVIDLYLGPTASYIIWGDINVKDANFGDDNGADNQFAWGALVGLDIGFGKTFAITLGVRWLDVDLKPDGSSDSVGVDPLISRLGVAFRF
jgi:outer membrane protein W